MESEGWVNECLKDVPNPEDFLRRLGTILRVPVESDGTQLRIAGKYSLRAKTPQELRDTARLIILKLSHLRTDVVQGRQKMNAACALVMAQCPTVVQKARVRQTQLNAREGYTGLIQQIDSLLLQFKGQLEAAKDG